MSRRWDVLRAAIGQVLADCVLAPAQVAGNNSTLLVDGTIAPTWDWSAIPDLFSGKAGYAGMNIQIAATMTGQVAAIGPIPVRGARHKAHAFARHPARLPGHVQHQPQRHPHRRRACDRPPQNLEDAIRGRRPVPAATAKYGEMLKAITGLFFSSNYFQPYE